MCCKLGSESANHVFLFFFSLTTGPIHSQSLLILLLSDCCSRPLLLWHLTSFLISSGFFLSLLSHIFFTFSHFQIVFVLPPPLVSELLYSVYRQTTAAIFFLCVERYLTNINLISFKCLFYPFYSIIYVQPLSFHIIINVYLFLQGVLSGPLRKFGILLNVRIE